MISHLAIFDMASGTSETLLQLDQHIEAPNWTRDGNSLVVNGGGRLYKVPLAAPQLQVIDTGFANKLNNDHGISPDGKMLAISDATETGQSCIYTLPFDGTGLARPQRITQRVPSYWHGWSPDGITLTYTAKRGDTFQIYTCPAGGGAEKQITRGFDHCDGPDYSPDGEWIWFNGERDGTVELYKIRPDGSDLQRMTFDNRVNWFPHPSPDGQNIVYLAYQEGTTGHPANRQVELRMMPANGGSTEVLAHFNGGQGTINVPSWAPDSRRFAYVFYEVSATD
ncbi:MAG: hypothetical protein GKR97_11300 [Rhizobiaceae bacterium]|nr:hypothetical protein [Rhizobiaceae bacterium]